MKPARRLAIIDLGTNTFHLLVIEAQPPSWKILYRKRIFVNLAEIGIGRISDAAIDRGLAAMHDFKDTLEHMKVVETRAVGTAALRTADNAAPFLQEVVRQTGISVQVVDGAHEAQWIARGVLQALPSVDDTLLIMDIGGGSVEFILAVNGQTRFSRSYPIGVAVLYEQFHDVEPISENAIAALNQYLDSVLSALFREVSKHPDCMLVGASGTFEVVDSIVAGQLENQPYSSFAVDDFDKIYQQVIVMDLADRLAHPGIPESRARYIVVAIHLIHFVLSKLANHQALISSYAMKEGIATDWILNLD